MARLREFAFLRNTKNKFRINITNFKVCQLHQAEIHNLQLALAVNTALRKGYNTLNPFILNVIQFENLPFKFNSTYSNLSQKYKSIICRGFRGHGNKIFYTIKIIFKHSHLQLFELNLVKSDIYILPVK